MLAAANNQLEMVRFLLARGADPTLTDPVRGRPPPRARLKSRYSDTLRYSDTAIHPDTMYRMYHHPSAPLCLWRWKRFGYLTDSL